jgi:hypothetical protein
VDERPLVPVEQPRMYMNPWSSGSPRACAPAASALSAMSCGAMKPAKNGSTANITEVSSLMIMRVAFSSVNC